MGPEPFSLGVVAGAAKAAIDDDPAAKRALVVAAQKSEGFDRAAVLRGQRMAARQQAVLNLLRPLYRLLGVGKEYFESEAFSRDLAARTQHIPDENLQSPNAPLAAAAIQGLGWSLDEPALKEMYLNLLASASDDRRSDAHPSFVEVIRQLDAREARWLTEVLGSGQGGIPIAEVRKRFRASAGDADSRWVGVTSHLTSTFTADGDERRVEAIWLDNWARLRLVQISYRKSHEFDASYNWIDEHPQVIAARASLLDGHSLEVRRGLAWPTAFGGKFLAVVTPHGAKTEEILDRSALGANPSPS